MGKRTARRGAHRTTARKQQARRQQMMIIGVVVVAAILIIGVAYAATNDPDIGQKFADLGNRHLSEAPSAGVYPWNSVPPTSGPHAPNLAAWGEHQESVPEWLQIHNLEDGGVIMHYNCPDGCDEVVSELRAIMAKYGEEQLVLHPYSHPEMESVIAVTAWTRMITMDEVKRGQIEDFIEAYRGIDHHR